MSGLEPDPLLALSIEPPGSRRLEGRSGLLHEEGPLGGLRRPRNQELTDPGEGRWTSTTPTTTLEPLEESVGVGEWEGQGNTCGGVQGGMQSR